MKKNFPAITRSQIQDYANASGDHNPIHLDESFARSAGFPSVIAHGMLSMGLIGEALSEAGFGPEKIKTFTVKFKDVAHLGARLSLESTPDAKNSQNIDLRMIDETGREICTGSITLK